MLNDRSSTLSLLETRRSGRPRDMVEPGPSETELARILAIATRTPDHGKLAPWRFVHVGKDRRDAFAVLLHEAWAAENPEAPRPAEREAVERLARQAPELVVAVFSPKDNGKIPLWEQELSCGAAVMNLELAAHALGYTAGWITGWAAYSDVVRDAFGASHEKIAGFLYLGTPGVPLEERPRPAVDDVVTHW